MKNTSTNPLLNARAATTRAGCFKPRDIVCKVSMPLPKSR